jgi:p24 family protein beta-1
MSTVTAKTVVFELNVGDAASKAGLAKATDIAYLDTAIYKLADSLNAISSEQHYLRNRERVHRNTTESTNARVLWWSFCEAAVLVAMSLWQIFYLKRFFEVKRVV